MMGKACMTGVAQRDEILVNSESLLGKRSNTVDMKYYVFIIRG